MSKTRFHINKSNLETNLSQHKNLPVIICTDEAGNEDFAHLVIIYGKDGKEAARIIYDQAAVLKHGVRVWIETENKIEKIQK